ncbi:unnamed protein product [Danaus chrysippus]|uniref:Lipase n=1 Tax=Danaus chrysippus TaxID=151541 RepID=A0A8J2QX27_9NEOP|nr:unnamed protein product [Danaus chrysippus]
MLKWIIVIVCLQEITLVSSAAGRSKLISYALPENRELKKALGYNEDTYLTFQELTTKYGYVSENHTVRTEDDYLLTVFRILPRCKVRGFPVILVHGIFDSSDTWIFTGPQNGLAYILSDNCYDVWAANMRGNTYSRRHVNLNPNTDAEYWEYSFDEHGNYDVPAVIDYVLALTGTAQVYYIGHSQGTTDYFAMGSLRPEYNNKIRLSVQIAPIAFLKNIRSPVPKLISILTEDIKNFAENVGLRELFAKQHISHVISEFLCQIAPNLICGTALWFSTGNMLGSITAKNLAIGIGHLFAGVSLKTLAHFGQLINSGKFQRYDEGVKGNMLKYGYVVPPKYNVSLVSSPMVLVTAENDWLSTLEDIKILSSKLPNIVDEYIVPVPTWSHNNHLWGINATVYVFNRILEYFERFNT